LFESLTSESTHPVLPPLGGEDTVRLRLLKSAIELFGRKGYAATSVNDIVTAAKVTKPNLYYYFTSKAGIYYAILNDLFSELDVILNRATQQTGPSRERLTDLCCEMYQHFTDNLDTARMIYVVYFGPPQGAPDFDFDAFRIKHHRLIEQIIQMGILEGEIKPGNTQEMMMAVVGLMHTAMELELCHSGPRLGREGLIHVLNLLFEGLSIKVNR
jgi:TetR/AcrR family transcriptional regulator